MSGTSNTHNQVHGPVSGVLAQVGVVHGGVHLHTLPGAGPPPVPHQLPPQPVEYTNHDRELREMEAAVGDAHTRGRTALVVPTGPAGAGKTALALHYLHTRADADGELYADLRGHTFAPSGPDLVLERLLASLGADPVPGPQWARAAAWRSATAGHRLALLVDDARTVDQVRPLLPGGGNHTVIVTTRRRLDALRLDGAHPIHVGPLAPADGARLLACLSGHPDTRPGDLAARERVSRLCSGLPLTLGVLAVRQHTRPRPWADLAHDLAANRLSHLDLPVEESVSSGLDAVIDVALTLLPDPLVVLYRRLPLHPGPDLTPDVAAALTGTSPEEGRDALIALASFQLLQPRGDRWLLPGLVREHAARRAADQDTRAERSAAAAALVAHYADRARAVDRTLRHYATGQPAEPGLADASTWLYDEADNVAALAGLAVEEGLLADAVALTEGLWPLALHHGRAELLLSAAAPVITALRQGGESSDLGRLLGKTALAHSQTGQTDKALADLDEAEEIWERTGDLARLAQVLQRRGTVLLRADRCNEALAQLRLSLATDESIGVFHNRGVTLYQIGLAHLSLDEPEDARAALIQALPLLEGDERNTYLVGISLGRALTSLGRAADAEQQLNAALEAMVRIGSLRGQAQAWEVLGELAEHQSDPARAREAFTRALELLGPGSDRDRVRAHLGRVAGR
jgi:tetratricopeptide (TPR) repeat protein